jgi:glycosyltransferase involved in cell wall biosynthesis
LDKPGKSLSILYIVPTVGETSCAYNEFSRPLSRSHNITLCSYCKATVTPAPGIILFEGDGTVLGFFRALKTALDNKRYDIIHGHMAASGVLFLIANLLHRRSLKSTVFTVHNCYQNHKFRNQLLLIPIFIFFQRVVCCSRSALESFPPFYKWLAGSRLSAIQNGVDMERVDSILGEEQYYVDHGRFTVLSVGRIIKIKNPLTVLNAFRQSATPTNRLVFVGEGDLLETLRAKINECALKEQVELTGLISRNQVYQALAQADVFISTSLGEGLPVAALEAMACRCPAILSDIQPHWEIATGTDFIPLIPANDEKGFAQELRRFQAMSLVERETIGEKCRAWIEEHFSLTAMHKRYIELYEQLCV